MNQDLAKQLEDSVRNFYEVEGAWFATTRDKVMPEQRFVAEYIRPGMTVVDVGAGNGRFAKLLPEDVTYVGVEPSETLREKTNLPARSTRFSIIYGSLPHLPVPDKTADVTVCLAVLHHLPTRATRRSAIEELARVTKPGGVILATSWLRHPEHRRARPITDGESGDVWMPWEAPDGHVAQRFVHFMQPGEWQELWANMDLDVLRSCLFAKQAWTDDANAALNWRLMARKR